jgi:hypothetical protein
LLTTRKRLRRARRTLKSLRIRRNLRRTVIVAKKSLKTPAKRLRKKETPQRMEKILALKTPKKRIVKKAALKKAALKKAALKKAALKKEALKKEALKKEALKKEARARVVPKKAARARVALKRVAPVRVALERAVPAREAPGKVVPMKGALVMEALTAGAARKGVRLPAAMAMTPPQSRPIGARVTLGLPDPLNQQTAGRQRRGPTLPQARMVAPLLATALIRSQQGQQRTMAPSRRLAVMPQQLGRKPRLPNQALRPAGAGPPRRALAPRQAPPSQRRLLPVVGEMSVAWMPG